MRSFVVAFVVAVVGDIVDVSEVSLSDHCSRSVGASQNSFQSHCLKVII